LQLPAFGANFSALEVQDGTFLGTVRDCRANAVGLLLRLTIISPAALGISITWRGTGYVLPPGSISIALATVMYFFATIYSLWMLPFSPTATLLHFGLTTLGIVLFWVAFYLTPNSRAAVWTVLRHQQRFYWRSRFFFGISSMPYSESRDCMAEYMGCNRGF
jgi:hypothetical protein